MQDLIDDFFPFVESQRAFVLKKASTLKIPHENFQYVSLSKFPKKCLPISAKEGELSSFESFILPECRESVFVFINGIFSPQFSRRKNISSVLSLPISEAESSFDSFLEGRLAHLLQEEIDPLPLLNYATSQEGLFIYLPARTKMAYPLQILHVYTEDFAYFAPRTVIFMGKESQCDIYSTECFLGESQGWSNGFLEIVLEERAELNLTMLFNKAHLMTQTHCVRSHLKKDSQLKALSLGEGKHLFRQDLSSSLHQGAQVHLSGAFLLDQKSESHIHTNVEHREENAFSLQKYKTVLKGQSRKSFTGKIHVHKNAQKTQAYQMNKNLLLSDFANAYSKPNLEIYADDVKASHGATVGKINEEELFYLKARGLPEEKARSLLVEGFYQEIMDQIPLESAKNYARFSQ